MKERTITLTIEQAKTALYSVENDIQISEFSEIDYSDAGTLGYYMRRAELLHALKCAIENAGKA